jgi:hypothetical protein
MIKTIRIEFEDDSEDDVRPEPELNIYDGEDILFSARYDPKAGELNELKRVLGSIQLEFGAVFRVKKKVSCGSPSRMSSYWFEVGDSVRFDTFWFGFYFFERIGESPGPGWGGNILTLSGDELEEVLET